MKRDEFLRSAVALEIALLIVSAVLVAFWSVPRESDPLVQTGGLGTGLAMWYGTAAGVALFPLFVLCWQIPWRPLRTVRESVVEALGPFLKEARHRDLWIMALCAGICEEVLFRGVLEPRIGSLSTNILFGLCHFVTWMYFVFAIAVSVVLSWIQATTGNLWCVIAAHTVYDLLAFYWLWRWLRQPTAGTPTGVSDTASEVIDPLTDRSSDQTLPS